MREVQQQTKEVEKNVKPLTSALGEVEKAMAGVGVAATAAGAPFVLLAKNAIDSADALSKMAQRTGLSTETLSALKQQAALADVSMESLGKAMLKQSLALDKASDEGKKAEGAFLRLGLS